MPSTPDGDLFAGEVLAPAHDLEGLQGSGLFEVAKDRGFEASDLDEVLACGLVVVVETDVPPGQLFQPGQQMGWLALTTAM
ncbi:hypothetical protein [Streptomyces scopuliridis]|uniref:hypothetical protein n=1 Tax=Streptomyces scopuliridis TaxID=452529 RepID=UPI0036C1FABB